MSNIIDRPFDASNKLHRSVFKGAPNLYTTSDINRQTEALKWQIDYNENHTLVPSIFKCNVNNDTDAGTFTYDFVFDEIKAGGCLFKPVVPSTGSGSITEGLKMYIFLVATKKQVAKEYDPSIIGADFGEGSVIDAAEAIVFSGERIITTEYFSPTLGLNEVIVAYLGRIEVATFSGFVGSLDNPIARFYTNCLSKEDETLSIRQEEKANETEYRLNRAAEKVSSMYADIETVKNMLIPQFFAVGVGTAGDLLTNVSIAASISPGTEALFLDNPTGLYAVKDFNRDIYGFCPASSDYVSGSMVTGGTTLLNKDEDFTLQIMVIKTGGYFPAGKYRLTITSVTMFGNTTPISRWEEVTSTTVLQTLVFTYPFSISHYYPLYGTGKHLRFLATLT